MKKKGNTSALCRVFPIFLYNSHFISNLLCQAPLGIKIFGIAKRCFLEFTLADKIILCTPADSKQVNSLISFVTSV